MINIDPYIQKIEWLKEWIGFKVDYTQPVGKVLRSVDSTGIIMRGVSGRLISFEHYCMWKRYNQKQSLK